MNSHRKYIFLCLFGYSFFLLFLYYIVLLFSLGYKLIAIIIGYPLVYKIILMTYRHLMCKELLYTTPILITLQCIIDMGSIGDTNLWSTVIFYCCKFLSDHLLIPLLEIGSDLLAKYLYGYLQNG